MADYRYIFYTLRTEEVIADIPLYGTFFEDKINGPGSGNGTFQFDQTGKSNDLLVSATIPGRTAVAVERNGVVIWTGITWSRTYQSQAKSCQLYFWGFEAVPQRERMLTDVTYVGAPVNIFLQAWRDMQAVTGRNFNVNIPSNIAGLDLFTELTVHSWEQKYYGEFMQDLSDAKDSGFDWTIDVTRPIGTSQYKKTMRVGFPSFGAVQSSSSLIFEYPGSITNYYETESMASGATHLRVLGAGENESMLVADSNLNLLVTQSGWPRWDIDISRKDVQNQTVLNGIADQQGIIHQPPMSVIKATLKGDLAPDFGSYSLGDNCTLVIKDAKHPTALQLPTRVIGWELTPASSESTEEVNVSFAMELDTDV